MAELIYPYLLRNTEAFPASIFFTFYDRRSTQKSDKTDTVMMYMPESFGQPNTVRWDTFSALEALAGVAGTVSGSIGRGGKSLKGGRGGNFAAGVSKLLTQITAANSNLNNLGGTTTGYMPNPFMTQIFRGVDFRNFNMKFRLVPFHEDDCKTILDIIKTFRKWSLPDAAGGAYSPILKYPGEVEVEYKWAGTSNPWIHRFKRSVITNIDVEYTGAGQWSMMRNGFPAETVLNIQFSEIAIVVRSDVEGEGSEGNY